MKSTILSAALLFFLSPDLVALQGVNVCVLPSKTGFCRARIPRFYFDETSGRCIRFFYGGCGGNGNNFKTSEKCRKTCICRLPPQTGPCRAHFRMYYFDETNGQCKQFTYGGCRGNHNKFRTLEDCKQTCVSVCDLQKETGLCRARIPRFYFNEASGRCMRFFYGGCGGNGNNFKTFEECKETCGAE